MIGQQLGLKYLVPLALKLLSENLFAEGDFYEGDLLKSLFDVEIQFWKNNQAHWLHLFRLIEDHLDEIKQKGIDSGGFLELRSEIFEC